MHLYDAHGRGRNTEITEKEKAWIINITCQKPIGVCSAAELWTYSRLTAHIHKSTEQARYTGLSIIHKSTVHRILAEVEIKAQTITYYCENRDPVFDQKCIMFCWFTSNCHFNLIDENSQLQPFAQEEQIVYVLSYDEK